MRPLTDEETMKVFKKLSKFFGNNLLSMMTYHNEEFVLRLQRMRVYFVRADVAVKATNVAKEKLMSLGICIGKFTKTNTFFLRITALPLLNEFCIYKIWLKESGQKSFLYGNNVVKRDLLKVGDNIKRGDGVLVMSMDDNPIGFGICVRSTPEMKNLNIVDTIVIHQGDIGEYLRSEQTI